MIRTIASIFITLGLLIGVSVFEIFYVTHTFDYFNATLESLHQKNERANRHLRRRSCHPNLLEEQEKDFAYLASAQRVARD